MIRPIALAGAAASIGFLACSATANFLFGSSLGHTPLQGLVYGAVGVLAVAMNAFSPFYISWALAASERAKAASIVLLWTLCLVYSTSSALGFAAQNREHVALARAIDRNGYDDTRRELLDLEERRKGKVGAAEQRRIEKRIDETRRKLEGMRSHDAAPADAQSEFLSAIIMGLIPPGKIRVALVALFALMVEVGATLGLFAALTHPPTPKVIIPSKAKWTPKQP